MTGLQITNLYTAFLGLGAAVLPPGGQLAAITPRSFANGPYFLPFRRFFLSRMGFDLLHVYERRGKVFADADVLQENVVFAATRGASRPTITLSTSSGLEDAPVLRSVAADEVVHRGDPQLFIRIPTDEEATAVAARIASLPASLDDLGIQVSTGRVVDFRTRENLIHDPDPDAAPLVYPNHMQDGGVAWPRLDGRKPNCLALNDSTRPLLLPSGHYGLVNGSRRKRSAGAWWGLRSDHPMFHRTWWRSRTT